MTNEPKAYVVQGQEVFHASLSCRDLKERAHEGISWCTARRAHLSRLRPCSTCSRGLQSWLKTSYGSLSSGEKASLGFPRLLPLSPSDTTGSEEQGATDVPYGPAAALEDPRFSNTSVLGWGTSTYGQDPNEYLGDIVDDDNDWRGRGASR